MPYSAYISLDQTFILFLFGKMLEHFTHKMCLVMSAKVKSERRMEIQCMLLWKFVFVQTKVWPSEIYLLLYGTQAVM